MKAFARRAPVRPQRDPVPVAHHNRVVNRARVRALRLEPKLASVLVPILRKAGDEAARNFTERATVHMDVGATDDTVQQLLAAAPPPGWAAPAPDELIDVEALVQTLRTKTDPVRQAVVETTMKSSLNGVGIAYDVTNPFTRRVLAQSGSQVVNIAETTQLNVMRIVRESYDQGLSIPDTATAIKAGMAEASTARATLIARTELAGAVNGGSLAATQIVSDATGSEYQKVWMTAPGAQFPRHETYDGLDGQTVALDAFFDVGGEELEYPGDPGGSPEEVCNCLPGETLVLAPGLEIGFRRRYDGDLARIETDAHHQLAGTPNHPVLTATGWKPLGDVREGDYLVCCSLRENEAGIDPDVDHAPAPIKDVFGAMAGGGVSRWIRGGAVQFHGDGADGEVEVVTADGLLRHGLQAASGDPAVERVLVGAGEPSALLAPERPRLNLGVATASTTPGGMRGAGQATPILGRGLGHPGEHRSRSVPGFDAEFGQAEGNDVAADPVAFAQGLYGLAFEVSLAQVVSVELVPFHGDVFNLQTASGAYQATGLVLHNCRCAISYVEAASGQEVGGGDADTGPGDVPDGSGGDGGGGGGGGGGDGGSGAAIMQQIAMEVSAPDAVAALGDTSWVPSVDHEVWGQALPTSQREAIGSYTTSDYSRINPYLRGDTSGLSKVDLTWLERQKEQIPLIDRALATAPELGQATTLWRGVANDSMFGPGGARVGNEYTERAYSSTGLTRADAEGWARYAADGQTGVVLKIKAPAETRGAWVPSVIKGLKDFDATVSENEMLLARDTRYRVTAVDGNQVTVEIVQPAVKPPELTGIPRASAMYVPQAGIPLYRTEYAHEAYKGKTAWGDGQYFGLDKQATADLMLDPETAQFGDFGDLAKVDTHQLPDGARILNVPVDAFNNAELQANSGNELRQKVLDSGWDGAHIDAGDNFGGDQIVLYRSLDEIKAREASVEVKPPPPVDPVDKKIIEAATKTTVERPFEHYAEATLKTQVYRSKVVLRDLLAKDNLSIAEQTEMVKHTERLKTLLVEKRLREAGVDRPYGHYAEATLKTQIYRAAKTVEEITAKTPPVSEADLEKLANARAKLAALKVEQQLRGKESEIVPGGKAPKAPKAAREKVVPPPPPVKAVSERMARLQAHFAKATGETPLVPKSTLYGMGPEVEAEVTAAGKDLTDEVFARMKAERDARPFGTAPPSSTALRTRHLMEVLNEVRPMGREPGAATPFKVAGGSNKSIADMAVKAAESYPRDWLGKVHTAIKYDRADRGYFHAYGNSSWGDAKGGHLLTISEYGREAESVMLHELGHLMETEVPGVKALESAFYERRCYSEPTVLYRDGLFNGKRQIEVARDDKFTNRYMGIDYSVARSSDIERTLSEIGSEDSMYELPDSTSSFELLSMGIQGVMEGKYQLWEKDIDYVNFILGMLISV